MHIVEVVELDSAIDLLNELRDRTLKRSKNRTFIDIFRGVGHAEKHSLVPSALRPDFREKYLENIGKSADNWSANEQRCAESEVFKDFCETADRAALTLPPLPAHLDQYLKAPSVGSRLPAWRQMIKEWPHDSIYPHLAIAQHYGLPTRLLDWSTDGNVAAFFAAISCIKIVEETEADSHALAIWVANTALFDIIATNKSKNIHAQLIRPPYFQNANLTAQKGLFTLVNPEQGFDEDEFDSLDEYFIKKLTSTPENDPTSQMFLGNGKDVVIFTKLLLPAREALSLLNHLVALGSNHSTIFPGFEGAVETVKLRLKQRKLGDLFYRLSGKCN